MTRAFALVALVVGAQAFAPPLTTLQRCSSQRVAGSRRQGAARMSLDDLEKRLAAKAAPPAKPSLFGGKPAAKPVPVKAPAAVQKAVAPVAKAAAPAAKAAKAAVEKVAPPPSPAIFTPPKPASSGGAKGSDVVTGVALGALPWVVAPLAALGVVRPLLAKGAAAREAAAKKRAEEEAAKAAAEAAAMRGEGLTEADKGKLGLLAGVAAVSFGGLLLQPLLFSKPAPLPPAPVPVVKKAAPAPAPAPKPAPALAPKVEEVKPAPAPAPAPAPVPEPKVEAPAPAPKVEEPKPAPVPEPKVEAPAPAPKVEEPAPAPAPVPAPVPPPQPTPVSPPPPTKPVPAAKVELPPAAPASSGPGRVLEAETVDPALLKSLKGTTKGLKK